MNGEERMMEERRRRIAQETPEEMSRRIGRGH